MNFAVVNLGCKVNRVEADFFAAALISRGATMTPVPDAELILVNTCTVTGEAEKKARKAVRHALRENDRAAVIVTGCAAAISPDVFRAMSPRVRVVGKLELMEALERGEAFGAVPCVADCAPEFADDIGAGVGSKGAQDASNGNNAGLNSAIAAHSAIDQGIVYHSGAALVAVSPPHPAAAVLGLAPAAPLDFAAALPVGEGFRTRVGVKVQDGCDHACTYCIVHVARGRSTSRDADAVVAECVSLARAGVKEVVLTGIDLGAYCDGPRVDPASPRLTGLLRRLLDETRELHAAGEPPVRFRISSIEPRSVGEDLIELLAEADGRVCRHLHLPLQAGSEKVLREMARPYTPERFFDLVDRLRAGVPSISLSTDVIVGFPGEADEDFAATLAAARRCGFSRLHVFPYSRREGTPAAARTDQVAPEVKAARAKELRELGERLRAEDYARRVGTTELVLVEETGTATTESYHEVAAPAGVQPGQLAPLTLTAVARRSGL